MDVLLLGVAGTALLVAAGFAMGLRRDAGLLDEAAVAATLAAMPVPVRADRIVLSSSSRSALARDADGRLYVVTSLGDGFVPRRIGRHSVIRLAGGARVLGDTAHPSVAFPVLAEAAAALDGLLEPSP